MLHSPFTYKTNCYNFSLFLVFILSLSWKFGPHLACEYESFAFHVMCHSDLTLKKGKIKSCSYGLLTDISL